MGGEPEEAAFSLGPLCGGGDAIDNAAETPTVDRMLVERLAVVRQLVDAEILQREDLVPDEIEPHVAWVSLTRVGNLVDK
jgi:hypothetical protein